MGVEEEFEAIFDSLDPLLRGYVDVKQLQEFHQTFHCSPISLEQVEAALYQVCNGGNRCPKFCFLDVLFELERRRSIEEHAWWDFQALDRNGNNRIAPKDALILMKATHQDNFTMTTWRSFLESRESAGINRSDNEDVTFSEIRMWLCNQPLQEDGDSTGGVSSVSEAVINLGEEMAREKRKVDYRKYKELVALQEDESSETLEAKNRRQYQDQFRRKSRRKLNRWVNLGVEALIFDDGQEFEVDYKLRNRVTVQDLLEALEQKYDILREKLLWEAVKKHIAEPIWSSMSEGEQQEQVLRIQMKEHRLRGNRDLDQIAHLVVSYQHYDTRLEGMMGCLRSAYEQGAMDHQSRVARLEGEGKTEDEIYRVFLNEYSQRTQGTTTCGQLLIDLHQRYKKEREFLLSVLKMGNRRALSSAEMITEYSSLAVQQLMASYEGVSFEYSCMATGLAERPQQYKSSGFDSDRDLGELLALERLYQYKARRPPKVTDDDGYLYGKNRGVVAWQVEVVRQLLKKHTHEREVMIYLLQGKESATWHSLARRKSQEQREDRLKELRNQRSNWRQGSSEHLTAKRTVHLKILLEGTGLYHENRRNEIRGGHNFTNNQVSACVLADLQQRQAQEVEQVLVEMQTMTAEALKELWKREHRSRIEEWLDNISTVILSMLDLSNEEKELVQALEEKYDVLREKLLMESLMAEFGEKAWLLMSEEERQRLLVQRKLEERRLRREGKMDELSRLIGDADKDSKHLQKLMGTNREEYEKQLAARLARRERRRAMGQDSDDSQDELDCDGPESGGRGSSQNILKGLQVRYDEDMDALMAMLHRQQNGELSEKDRQALLLRLRREKRRAQMEDTFDEAALLLGLSERNRLNMEEKMRADRERQLLLARERLANRRRRKAEGKGEEEGEEGTSEQPDEGDLEGWREVVLKEMDRKHVRERELLLKILTDEGSEDLRGAASQMVQSARQERLQELKDEAEKLNPDENDERETRRDILEEAGAIKSILRSMNLRVKHSGGPDVDIEEVISTLLADLQEEQEKESEITLAGLGGLNEAELSKLRVQQAWERKTDVGNNLLTVFTQYEGEAEDDELLKTLDKKYDTLKDKLLVDILKHQLGAAEWARLKEHDRQKKLLELRQEERRLRKEGNLDQLAALLGDKARAEADLKKLMGANRTEYQDKLRQRRERLEERNRSVAKGGTLDNVIIEEEEGLPEDDVDVASKHPLPNNPLGDLQRRYESEREVLLSRLGSSEAEYMSEKDRQVELVGLRLELRKARAEESFTAAALVIGLAERNQATATERLRNDRQRQESLARQRMDAMKQRRAMGTIQEEEEENVVTETNDRNSMQDAVLRTMEKKHRLERETLYDLLQKEYGEDDVLIAGNMSQEQRQERLQDLMAQRQSLDIVKKSEHRALLEDASVLKLGGRQQLLEREADGEVISKDDLIVTIMADLQQQQAKEYQVVLHQLPDKDLKSLVHVQQQNINDQVNERNENVSVVVMTADRSRRAGEDELVDALHGKYDALKDKILTQALLDQMGAAEWALLSEKEQQVRLIKLRLRERRLRQEGKYDEAAALLGDALANQEAMDVLLGDTKKQQEATLRERMQKRRQRIAQGMTEEQANSLEQDEIKQEEELKKRRNILDQLDNRFDNERDALLAAMRDANNRLLSEKERQRQLAQLRRDERRARRENKFDAAALAIGITKQAQDADDLFNKERKRQEQLAKERLAQRRKLREERQRARDAKGPVPMPEDGQNKVAIQEAVVQEMEIKHEAEKDLLIELMEDQKDSSLRSNARTMTEENRQRRLQELIGARKEWRESGPTKQNQNEQIEIFNKATALTLESRLDDEKRTKGDGATKEADVQVALLADLQELQEQEAGHLLNELGTKTFATLRQLKQVQYLARSNGWNDNVTGTVLVTKTDSSEVTEEQLIKALEVKYDTLRDKLLSEALMKQVGEAEWARLSERERQAKLMKLKLQERKLRQAGKYSEASALLSQGIQDQQELAKLLGSTKSEQEERLKQRLERRRQLKEDRIKEGLDADDEALDEIMEKEEKRQEFLEDRKQRRNVLEQLNSHFEDEREALLAALHGKEASHNAERERQLALAKLRRDQRRLQMEDKFDTAALIFGMAQQQEKDRANNFQKDLDRQKQLARERLSNLRKKKEAKSKEEAATTMVDDSREISQEELLLRLRQEEEENNQVDVLLSTQKDVGVALHTTILDEIEKKHVKERDILLEVLDVAKQDTEEFARIEKLNDQELRAELKVVVKGWEEQQIQADVTDGDNLHAVVELHKQKKQALKMATLLKMEDYRRNLFAVTDLTSDEIQDEIPVSLLAELQQKQAAESSALNKILSSQDPDLPELDDSLLRQLIGSQRQARRELQLKNLEVVMFNLASIQEEEGEDDDQMGENERVMKELDDEMEMEKQELQEQVRTRRTLDGSIDSEALLAELEQQHAAKRKAMQEQLQRQRRLTRDKLSKRRQKQADKEYEEDAAAALIHNAEMIRSRQDKDTQLTKEKQTSLMKDRLAHRREQRRQAEQARQEKEALAKEAAKTASDNLPPGFGLQREKTVIDVNVSEEKKQALFNNLVREHTKAQLKIEFEQEKQAQQLKQRLNQRKTRYQEAASQLLGLGERHKTMIQKSEREERDRQITMVQERIQKVRFERTQTMKFQKDLNAKSFKDLMKEPDGKLSSDEKMAQMAATMQKKFLSDEEDIRKGNKRLLRYSMVEATGIIPPNIRIPAIMELGTLEEEPELGTLEEEPELGTLKEEPTVAPGDDDVDSTEPPPASPTPSAHDENPTTTGSRKLGHKERQILIKEKMANKKRKNRRASVVAALNMDSLSQLIQERKAAGPDNIADELTLS